MASPVAASSRVFGAIRTVGTSAGATVWSWTAWPSSPTSGDTWSTVTASWSATAFATAAASSGEPLVAEISMITVFSGVSAVTERASDLEVVSRSRRSITGSRTTGIVASCA
jgi:hypothetical protein